jgi:hypothetical protein
VGREKEEEVPHLGVKQQYRRMRESGAGTVEEREKENMKKLVEGESSTSVS